MATDTRAQKITFAEMLGIANDYEKVATRAAKRSIDKTKGS
jgi:hypothetical protein